MKFEFSVRTEKRTQLVNIDHLLQQAIAESKIKSGVCTEFVPHTTAAVTITENADPSVVCDILKETEKIIPFQDNYTHMEGNSAAHIKSSLFGSSETIIIENGRPAFGTWQSLYFCDFDGPRNRRVWFSFISENR